MSFNKLKKTPEQRVRERALEGPEWITRDHALRLGITPAEQRQAWLDGPAKAAAANWYVRSYDEDRLEADYVYRRFALHVHAQGWSSLPEDRKDRAPAYLGRWIKDNQGKPKLDRYPVKPLDRRHHQLHFTNVFSEMNALFIQKNNLAITIGAASGHVRAIDCDILDEELAAQVYEIAMRVFGPTPFIRVGRAPKFMLLYRMQGKDLELPKQSVPFLGADGRPDLIVKNDRDIAKNAIEFLAEGSNFTCYGLHHGTGRSFDWSRGEFHPAIAGSDKLPFITRAQVLRFYRECNDLRPVHGYSTAASSDPTGGESAFTEFSKSGRDGVEIWVPRIYAGPWQSDKEGYIVKGREGFLRSLIWAYCSANPHAVRTAAGRAILLEAVLAHGNHIKRDGKYTDTKCAYLIRTKLSTAVAKWQRSIAAFDATGSYEGKIVPYSILADGNRRMPMHVQGSARPADGSLDWLPEQPGFLPELSATTKIKGLVAGPKKSAEQLKADRADRALIGSLDERLQMHTRVASEIDAAIAHFLTAVENQADDVEAPLHILRAPTGAGKTTRAIAAVGAWCKANPRTHGAGPILFVLPTHANIDEALNVAEANGMIVPRDAEVSEEEAIDSLAALGVKVTVFRGKARAGCQRVSEMTALTKAGIGASSLCGTDVDEEEDELVLRMKRKSGEKIAKVEVLCEFRERGECEYWNQMSEVAGADIVFVAHAYLTMHSIPKVLKKARSVIVDESVVYRMLHQQRIPLDTVKLARRVPYLTKAEKAEYPGRKPDDVGQDMLNKRDVVADIVLQAFRDGKDPAAAIMAAGAEQDLETALTVVRRSHSAEREITPRMSAKDIADLIAKPKGKDLIGEEKLWRLLAERIDDIRAGTARGETDARLQLVEEFADVDVIVNGEKVTRRKLLPHIRMSWRSEANWAGVPMMLLDASASPRIMAKCFDRPVTVIDVDAKLRVHVVLVPDRPFSNKAFIPGADATEADVFFAEKTVSDARALAAKMAGVYSNGRLLVGSALAVRNVLHEGAFTFPNNVDFVHFGALRGRDFAKHHGAALSIGRSEQPVKIVDGYAAALTYDDPQPEAPYDVFGNGMTAGGKPLFRVGEMRQIPLRTGTDLFHMVPEVPGSWGKELEAQWREEELKQFLGRLRPVYRGGNAEDGESDEVPVWVCMSSCLPPGIVVDEIFALQDMLVDREFWEVVRRADGVLAQGITEREPLVAQILEGRSIATFSEQALNTDALAARERIIASMHAVKFRIAGEDGLKTARVAGWHRDPVAAVLGAAGRLGIQIEIESVELATRQFVSAARAPDPDRIDVAIAETAELLGGPRAAESYLRTLQKLIVDQGGLVYGLGDLHRRLAANQDVSKLIPDPAEEEEYMRKVREYQDEHDARQG